MKRLAVMGTGLLVVTALTSCADPFANATAELSITGQTEIVGETVELTVQVDGVNAEKVITIEEQLSGGDWVELETFELSDSELTASLKDVIDEASSVGYRAVLRSTAGGDAVFETTPLRLEPITLEAYVDQYLDLSLAVVASPDASGLLFDGDQVGLEVSADMRSAQGLEAVLNLRYEGGSSQRIIEGAAFGSSQVDWNVELASSTPETGLLVLEALISGATGTVSRTQNLEVEVANPLEAYEQLRDEVNLLSSNADRRELLVAAAGEVFLDQSSAAWQQSLGVQFIFDEPFLGDVMGYESSSGFQVPSGCAPGGQVDSFALAGRSFIVETSMANYSFNETLFGNFDGDRLTFSAAWKFCIG